MIRFKRSLLWAFSFLFFTAVLIESWQSVQYIFSTSSNDNSTTTPRPRYQRDYTTLTAYLVGLILLYCILLFYQRFYSYLFNIKNNNKTIDSNVVNAELNIPSLD